MLKYYLTFSKYYKKFVGSKLNESLDLKLKIWDFFKINISKDIINNFIFNNICQCTECFTIKFKKNIKYGLNNFYKVSACFTEPFHFTDTLCCEKLICTSNCYFNIKCKQCNHTLENISLPYSDDDQGWSPIEGKTEIEITCWECDCINYIPLVMYDCLYNSTTIHQIGKQISNKKKFNIVNNKKIIQSY